jgi:hypothetical protein
MLSIVSWPYQTCGPAMPSCVQMSLQGNTTFLSALQRLKQRSARIYILDRWNEIRHNL